MNWDCYHPVMTLVTFQLRDAKWTNGDPVRASDFVWTWQRVLNPATGSRYAYHLYYIAGAEAINSGQRLSPQKTFSAALTPAARPQRKILFLGTGTYFSHSPHWSVSRHFSVV